MNMKMLLSNTFLKYIGKTFFIIFYRLRQSEIVTRMCTYAHSSKWKSFSDRKQNHYSIRKTFNL